jgi:hypothetical protein
MNPTRVLLIEDSPFDVELARRALKRANGEFILDDTNSLVEALDRLEPADVDVVLLDWRLPDSDGVEAVRRIRGRHRTIPIIVTTALSDDEAALDALKHGAQDYLIKDTLDPETLERAIRYAIQRQRYVFENERLVRRLREAKALLEKKNRRLAKLYKTAHRFVNHVSHEFRTPLTVIKEYVSIINERLVGEVSPEQSRMLDIVNDRADDLNHMVEDMLDTSKLEAGLLGAHRQQCSVPDIIEHVRAELERKAAVRGVAFRTSLDPDIPEAYCDPEKVGRVVVNLVVNAIKFSSELADVHLWARPSDVSRDVVIGVTDNGPGIDPKNLDRIFGQFKQLASNARGSTDGFGLGLGIAKELVELNLGEIHVDSRLGEGSTFSFTVPIFDYHEVARRYVRRLRERANGCPHVSLFGIRIAGDTPDRDAADVDSLLNYALHCHDLLIRVGPMMWLWAAATARSEPGDRNQRDLEHGRARTSVCRRSRRIRARC